MSRTVFQPCGLGRPLASILRLHTLLNVLSAVGEGGVEGWYYEEGAEPASGIS